MRSKWFKLRHKAVKLRQQGTSIREIENRLNIPKSTLSHWLKNVVLTQAQRNQLQNNWRNALIKARVKAALWHNRQKAIRMKVAEEQAMSILNKLDINDRSLIELALAMLYLGEGLKNHATVLGNSNPLVLRFFISAIVKVYNLDIHKIKCELHLRADQNPEQLKSYWAKELSLPLTSFTSVSIDRRTIGSPTYNTYNGVCVLQCGNIAIQRRLVYLSKLFCERLANSRAVSSVGRASA